MFFRCLAVVPKLTAELTQRRCLFSAQRLGLQSYVEARNCIECPQEKHEYLHSRISLLINENSDVPSELLLYFMHVSNGTPKSVELLKQAILRYVRRDEYLQYGSPRVGVTLMRFLYKFNLLALALEFYERDDMTDLFSETVNVTLLMNGLYVNGQFDDVIKVYQMFARRWPKNQFDLKMDEDSVYFSPNCILLFFTACYRLNTDEACEKAEKTFRLLEDTVNKENINRRVISVFLMLLMNRGRLEQALHVVTSRSHHMVGVFRDLKILLYAKLGRLEEAISMLRTSFDDSLQPTSVNYVFRHSPDMLEQLESLVKEKMDPEITRSYEEVAKALLAFNRIGSARLDDILTAPLHKRGDMNDGGDRRNFSGRTVQKFDPRPPVRYQKHRLPGLRDMID